MKRGPFFSLSEFSKSLLTLALILFSLAGCQEEETDTLELPSDAEITKELQAQFSTSDAITTKNIDIETTDGIVTLTGSIDNHLAKDKATEIAQNIHGVLSVVNNLKISADRPDEAIENNVIQAISTDAVTELLKISVEVQNGLVTLKGVVDSWQQKQLAANIVKGIKGVTEIENTILVQPAEIRPEEQIKQEVEQTLRMDSRVRDAQINVRVDSSTVILTGAVGSAYEKQLASNFAYIAGVDSVVADRLEVHPEYRPAMLQGDFPDLTGEQIKNAIQKAFAYDPRVPEKRIKVVLNEDVAILSGTVNNLNSKRAAESDASNTVGVNTVENNIEVRHKIVVEPEIPITDEAIQKRINLAIQRDPYIESANISASATDGAVVLEGEVHSEFKKEQVEKVVSNVKGVIAIKNNVEVVENPET